MKICDISILVISVFLLVSCVVEPRYLRWPYAGDWHFPSTTSNELSDSCTFKYCNQTIWLKGDWHTKGRNMFEIRVTKDSIANKHIFDSKKVKVFSNIYGLLEIVETRKKSIDKNTQSYWFACEPINLSFSPQAVDDSITLEELSVDMTNCFSDKCDEKILIPLKVKIVRKAEWQPK